MWSIGKKNHYSTIFKDECTRPVILRLLALWAVVQLAAVQCTSEDTNILAETVRIHLPSAGGAAFSSYIEDGEADIFVFEDDRRRRLDTYQRMKVKDGTVSAVSTTGPKIIAVVVNSGKDRKDWAGIDSWDALDKVRSRISEEDPESPLMSGYARIGSRIDRDCRIELSPLLAQVVVRSISCDFTGKAYENESLKDAKVYLTNVSASCGILDGSGASVIETINTAGLNASDLALLQSPGILSARLPSSIGSVAATVDASLYCYPNSCREESLGSRFTRLVIEGKVRGVTYYWPIDINREDFGPVQGSSGIERNRKYVFDIKLTRTGSFDPDVPVSAADVEINCRIEPWHEMDDTTEMF